MSRPFEVSKFQKSAPSLNFTRTFVVGRAIYSHPGVFIIGINVGKTIINHPQSP
jgi:hypothetical protein